MVTASSATDYCPACGDQLDPILGGYRLNVATFNVTLDCLGKVLPYMTSAVGGGSGVPKKQTKGQNQLICDSDKGGGAKKI